MAKAEGELYDRMQHFRKLKKLMQISGRMKQLHTKLQK